MMRFLNPFKTISTVEYWTKLPVEIRSMIFEMVAKDYRFKCAPYARAGYASVCREWQQVFEPLNFQELVLDQERISDLENLMCKEVNIYRQNYLEHLFLRVRLEEYDCTVCLLKEDYKTIRNNNDVFTRAVLNLLIILSKWTECSQIRRHHRREQGLTLELGSYSPSDSEHTFKYFHLEHNYPYHEEKELDQNWDAYKLRADRCGLESLNDPYHRWIDGRRTDITLESKQRIMGTLTINFNHPEFSSVLRKVLKVKVVTGLLIRRQSYRQIAVSSLKNLLCKTFTRLRWFRHEGWHNINEEQQLIFEKYYRSLISSNLPNTLRELFIFEDFHKILHPRRSSRLANPSLGKTLSKSSCFLEHLSAAFLVDALHFFDDFWPDKQLNQNILPWENLRTLTLTSCVLHPLMSPYKVNELLIAAGRATTFMPSLLVMEIWNGDEGHACVFSYSNFSGKPQIIWSSNWNINEQFDQYVVRFWARLPQHGKNPHCNLKTELVRLPLTLKQVENYITAVSYSKLRGSVLDINSKYQLTWEGYNRSNTSA